MRRPLSIRIKLLLLAVAPALGALLLGLMVGYAATAEARKAQALGSVESVAAVSSSISAVVQSLQEERALSSLYLGRRAAKVDVPALRAEIAAQREARRAAQEKLDATVRGRDLERLPPRLAAGLKEAREGLARVDEANFLTADRPDLGAFLGGYHRAIAPLVEATAGLGDLSDDGDLLRIITCLVAALELKERVSEEHAILAYAFSAVDFPPGTYRTFVNLLTEQEAFDRAFRTYATPDILLDYEAHRDHRSLEIAGEMRMEALRSADDPLRGDADAWFRVERANVGALLLVEQGLNARVRATALAKIAATRLKLGLSAALVLAVALSLLVTWRLAIGIGIRVLRLRDASERVGRGDLAARVTEGTGDELGQLAAAFNAMTAEIARGQLVLAEQARMARELEIAADIQRKLLPPRPLHPDFEFAGRMIPASEVGGDFYDVLTRPGESALWITIGDVSSHGLGAGVVMVMTQAAFAAQFQANPAAPPDEALRAVNSMLSGNIVERLKDDKYVTAQLFAYRGDGRFACAGAHQILIILRALSGRADVLEVEGPWLGILGVLPRVPVMEIALEPGDVLCLYSDGLTEAQGPDGEIFDLPRLTAALERRAREGLGLEKIADAILEEVAAFSGPPEDDRTLLLVRRSGATAEDTVRRAVVKRA